MATTEPLPAICPSCDGTGWIPAWDPIVEAYALTRCPDCEDT